MTAAERYVYISTHGLDAYRAWANHKKRIQRLRRRLVGLNGSGKPLKGVPFIQHGGVAHPLDCRCYDCLYGEVAAWKREALDKIERRA